MSADSSSLARNLLIPPTLSPDLLVALSKRVIGAAVLVILCQSPKSSASVGLFSVVALWL
jgi:hypothetical protein